MVPKVVLICALYATALAKDDQKWAWNDNHRDQTSRSLNYDRDGRYEVYEDEGPQFNPSQPYYERPYRPDVNPINPVNQINPINRPGGVYGGSATGIYGQNHIYPPQYPTNINDGDPEILTGPVPSWVNEGPYKNYDKCKCSEKFNCNSPGISYGHCDVGKQYCCYTTKPHEQIGGPLPSRPVHSPENGILVGPGGPSDIPRPGQFNRPGRPIGSFGLGGGIRGDYGPVGHRPIHSPENGILVGPGGPFDRPGRPGYGGFGLGRSAKN